MNKFNSNQKIGDIVTKFPGVGDIFKEYKVDFCCGGDKLLSEAVAEQGLNESEILEKINDLYKKFESSLGLKEKNWVDAPFNELVDHIINRHHGYLYEILPKISKLTTTILKVHGGDHPELLEVHKLFHTIKMELDVHLIKEETAQYLAIKEYVKSKNESDLHKAINIIKELKEEHTGAGDILKELRTVTNDYEIPADVCGTYELTYEKLQEMEADLFQHIHLENNILFPRLFQLKK